MKKTDDLILLLSENLTKTKVQKPLQRFGISTLIVFVITSILTLIVFSLRYDLGEVLRNKLFLFSTISSFLISLLSFLYIIYSGVPGNKETNTILSALIFFIVLLFLGLVFWPNESLEYGKQVATSCTTSAVLLGMGTMLVFVYLVKKSAPVHPIRIGVACGLAAAAVGMAFVAFVCPNEHGYHLLVWHLLLPLIFFTSIGQIIGRKILRW